MEKTELQQKLLLLIDAYKDVQTQARVIEALEKQRSDSHEKIVINNDAINSALINFDPSQVKPDPSNAQWLIGAVLSVGLVCSIPCCLLVTLGDKLGWSNSLLTPIILSIIAIASAILFPLCWKSELKSRAKNKTQKIEKLNQLVENNKELIAQKQKDNTELEIAIPRLDAEIESYRKLKANSEIMLDAHYFHMKDILPDKYKRNLSAICSFYDYVSSGRTYSIVKNPSTNDEGAVNIYERERLMFQFMEKLDQIYANLNLLHEDQVTLRKTVEESNNTTQNLLEGIHNSIKTGNKQRENIQYQNEQSLRYQQFLAHKADYFR